MHHVAEANSPTVEETMRSQPILATISLSQHGNRSLSGVPGPLGHTGGGAMGKAWRNQLFYGDNLDVLRNRIDNGSVDLIYLDPPFNSSRTYNVMFKHKSGEESRAQIEAFDDTWGWSQDTEEQYQELINGGAPLVVAETLESFRRFLDENDVLAYLVMMTARLVELQRVLKPGGSIYLHCDPTASHYLKIIMDGVFGGEAFQNEIVWHYRGGGVSKSRWGRRHDILLYYTKGRVPTTFNVDSVRDAYSPETLARLRYKAKSFRGDKIYDKYEQNPLGKHPDDVWDMQPIMPSAKERLGYPTQKPERLLDRIILASSNEGDIVLDPFCGCGTTISAAHRLNRRWYGIDVTYLAIDLIEKRLRHTYGEKVNQDYTVVGIPRDVEAAEALFHRSPFEFERWAVSLVDGQPNERQVGDHGSDGLIRFYSDGKTPSGHIVVSVKGGRRLGPQVVRDLLGTVQTRKAEGGVLITLSQPTKGMIDASRRSGVFYHDGQGKSFPKIQLISIADLLSGKSPRLPPVLLPYVQAKRANGAVQQTMF